MVARVHLAQSEPRDGARSTELGAPSARATEKLFAAIDAYEAGARRRRRARQSNAITGSALRTQPFRWNPQDRGRTSVGTCALRATSALEHLATPMEFLTA